MGKKTGARALRRLLDDVHERPSRQDAREDGVAGKGPRGEEPAAPKPSP